MLRWIWSVLLEIGEYFQYLWNDITASDRNETEWDLVTAIPATRSLTPRAVSRQIDRAARQRKDK